MSGRFVTSDCAATIVSEASGQRVLTIRRFGRGLVHQVFEAVLEDESHVVIKTGPDERRSSIVASVAMDALLRPLGLPLPEILATGLDATLPWVMLERLPGSDVGQIVGDLTAAQIDQIAGQVVDAQRAVATLSEHGVFGYAKEARLAPYDNLADAVEADIALLSRRTASAGLFDENVGTRLMETCAAMRSRLHEIESVAFMHDTTTNNVIVDPARLTIGIIDVEDLCFGDPRYVVGLTSAMLSANGQSQDYAHAMLRAWCLPDDDVFQFFVCVGLFELMSQHGQRWSDIVVESDETIRSSMHLALETELACLWGKIGLA